MATKPTPEMIEKNKAHHSKAGFTNTEKNLVPNAAFPAIVYRFITQTSDKMEPKGPIPVHSINMTQLNNLPHDKEVIIRLGHSSIYLQLAGKKILIDPVFAERVSPFSFAGPKRFHQPPIPLEQLDNIDLMIISHDHYDHLDKKTIKALTDKVNMFIVPLGVNEHLTDWGVPQQKITTLDWWESIQIDQLQITSTPGQHFSGRGLFDSNETLWSSYAIKSDTSNIFFSGDSGYFPGFKEIGERLGPFDITMVETGAY